MLVAVSLLLANRHLYPQTFVNIPLGFNRQHQISIIQSYPPIASYFPS